MAVKITIAIYFNKCSCPENYLLNNNNLIIDLTGIKFCLTTFILSVVEKAFQKSFGLLTVNQIDL